jgi:hypothetical protein
LLILLDFGKVKESHNSKKQDLLCAYVRKKDYGRVGTKETHRSSELPQEANHYYHG